MFICIPGNNSMIFVSDHVTCFFMLSQDKEQGKSIVVVGSWSHAEHLEWSKKNVARTYQLKEEGNQKVKYDIRALLFHVQLWQANVLT